mmetsp:Transcript_7434/g.8545  ORF Transcript_7434/g.8545 Transcript_7434/m.8545 type:complete len:131 (-) Transcript_7434:1228-1620(-)
MERKEKFLHDGYNLPWRMDAFAFGRKLNNDEQEQRRKKLSVLNLKGPIKMKHENLTRFFIIENILPPEINSSGKPLNIYFGRQVATGIIDVVTKLTLKKRKFLGPTSTETELSFLMANQVRRSKFSEARA